jgi:hypothetical protein
MNDQPHAGLCSRDLSALGVVINDSAVASVDRLAKVKAVEGILRSNYTTMVVISNIMLQMDKCRNGYKPAQQLRVYILDSLRNRRHGWKILSCMTEKNYHWSDYFILDELDKELVKDFFIHRGIRVTDSGTDFDITFFWN